MAKELITAESLFRKTIQPQQTLRKKLYKDLIAGKDKKIHYVIALNKWFFHDGNRSINIKDCCQLANRSSGATRVALYEFVDKYNLLNKNIIDSELLYTVRKNNNGKSQLQEIFKKYIESQNSN